MDTYLYTPRLIDMLVREVMFNLHEANCFGEIGMTDKRYQEVFDFYEGEVRAAITSAISPTDAVAIYTLADIDDRLSVLTDWDEESQAEWPVERRVKLLNDIVHGVDMAQAFEYHLDRAILGD